MEISLKVSVIKTRQYRQLGDPGRGNTLRTDRWAMLDVAVHYRQTDGRCWTWQYITDRQMGDPGRGNTLRTDRWAMLDVAIHYGETDGRCWTWQYITERQMGDPGRGSIYGQVDRRSWTWLHFCVKCQEMKCKSSS
jgi:hypothetical protein